MIVVAILTLVPGAERAFHDFETQAARIMARHRGAIERAIAVPGAAGAPAREVHVIRFADADAFAAYRADPALAALAPLRASAIAATELLVGDDGPDYSAPTPAPTPAPPSSSRP